MSIDTTQVWEALERWSPTAFVVAGVMFAAAAAVVVVAILAGGWGRLALVAEACMGAGWISGLVGLLGLYPALADRSRWLARASAVFAGIGLVAFAVLVVVSLAAFTAGSRPDTFPVPQAVILPGMLSGTVLAFVSFSIASLRSDVHSRIASILLLVPTALFLTNAFVLPMFVEPTQSGLAQPEVALGFASAVALAMLAIGSRLRTEEMPTDREERAPEATAG